MNNVEAVCRAICSARQVEADTPVQPGPAMMVDHGRAHAILRRELMPAWTLFVSEAMAVMDAVGVKPEARDDEPDHFVVVRKSELAAKS